MKKVWAYIKKNPLSLLLIVLPLALLAELLHWGAIWVFIFSALGVVPMASYIGSATEALAHYTGPKIGGLLNATLGNAAELIITLVAIKAGLLELVKASITGSIIGNLLLVMGLSMVIGGARHGLQSFDRRQSTNHAILLTLAILALAIPSFFNHFIAEYSPEVEGLSLGVSVVMILLYGLGILYSLKFNNSPMTHTPPVDHGKNHVKPEYTIWQAVLVLALATAGVVWLSELLVGAVEVVVADLGMSEFFLGIILIPIIGNVAEHLVAVQVAARNHMDLSVEIAVSSSLQIALFVAPLLVFISLMMGNPLTLVFNPFELVALGAAVVITALVCFDGESNWLEGAALLSIYLILGLAFFMMPVG
ncbi:MAG TPA: calcium/proton exchanger [Anaerolineaceae bacterium]|nr:calcium/proton exchanger [Anaerolineaceae bacterium]